MHHQGGILAIEYYGGLGLERAKIRGAQNVENNEFGI